MCPERLKKRSREKTLLCGCPGRSLFFFRMKSCTASLILTNLVSLHTKQGGVCQQYYWKETRSGTLADAFFNLHTLLDTTKTFLFKSYFPLEPMASRSPLAYLYCPKSWQDQKKYWLHRLLFTLPHTETCDHNFFQWSGTFSCMRVDFYIWFSKPGVFLSI